MADAPMEAALRYIRGLAAARYTADQSDGMLLRAFIEEQDQGAFTALVKRHGAMVLTVGRHVLPNSQDAEDVFQATFLLLARKAASIREAESLAGWLHGVAYRMAKVAQCGSPVGVPARKEGEADGRRGPRSGTRMARGTGDRR